MQLRVPAGASASLARASGRRARVPGSRPHRLWRHCHLLMQPYASAPDLHACVYKAMAYMLGIRKGGEPSE